MATLQAESVALLLPADYAAGAASECSCACPSRLPAFAMCCVSSLGQISLFPLVHFPPQRLELPPRLTVVPVGCHSDRELLRKGGAACLDAAAGGSAFALIEARKVVKTELAPTSHPSSAQPLRTSYSRSCGGCQPPAPSSCSVAYDLRQQTTAARLTRSLVSRFVVSVLSYFGSLFLSSSIRRRTLWPSR